MRRIRAAALVSLALAVVLGAPGCQSSSQGADAPRRATDPCAQRLHDLAGGLLAYFAAHGDLPEDLHSLSASPGGETLPPCVCPVSGQPYVYRREGTALEGRTARAVLYDATPAHDGMRWGIVMELPGARRPVTAQVLLFADESLREPR